MLTMVNMVVLEKIQANETRFQDKVVRSCSVHSCKLYCTYQKVALCNMVVINVDVHGGWITEFMWKENLSHSNGH